MFAIAKAIAFHQIMVNSLFICVRVHTQMTDASEVTGKTVTTEPEDQVDGNVVLKSKKASKSISKRKSRKKAKPTVEIEEHISKDDSMVDVETSVKDDFISTEDHSGSHLTTDTLPKSSVKLTLSDNEEPPEDFSFDDARQQIMMEEEHVKQHVARCVYIHGCIPLHM